MGGEYAWPVCLRRISLPLNQPLSKCFTGISASPASRLSADDLLELLPPGPRILQSSHSRILAISRKGEPRLSIQSIQLACFAQTPHRRRLLIRHLPESLRAHSNSHRFRNFPFPDDSDIRPIQSASNAALRSNSFMATTAWLIGLLSERKICTHPFETGSAPPNRHLQALFLAHGPR